MSKSIQLKKQNENVYPHPYYPVGSIYLSVVNTNPSRWFGGTWEQIAKGRTLVGVDTNDTDFNTVKKTGGNKTNRHNHAKTGDGGALSTVANVAGSYVVGNKNWVSSETISIMQPYFTCYIWCRTA